MHEFHASVPQGHLSCSNLWKPFVLWARFFPLECIGAARFFNVQRLQASPHSTCSWCSSGVHVELDWPFPLERMCTDGVSFKIMLLGTGLLYGSERCCSRVGCIGGYVYYTFTDVICFVLVWTHISSRPSLCCAPPYWPGRAAQEARIFAVERLACMLALRVFGLGLIRWQCVGRMTERSKARPYCSRSLMLQLYGQGNSTAARASKTTMPWLHWRQ